MTSVTYLSRELHILTRLEGLLIELLGDEVGDGPDHGHLLVLVVSGSDTSHILVHPYELRLARMTRNIAEILAKVVVTCRTISKSNSFGKLKVGFNVFKLIETTA